MSLARLTQHLEKHTGIDMARAGLGRALERYLDKRITELGLPSRDAYVDSLHGNAHELACLIDVVTVPHSWFFRDIQQWRAVETLLDRSAELHPVVRVWIPGCATGEDAYTLALIAQRRGLAVQIMASDINQGVLGRARRGIYNAWAIRDVPAEYRGDFRPRGEGHFELDEALRRTVTFAPHNLVEAPLSSRDGAWDLIVCRNVFIYILRAHAEPTLRRLGQTLSAGGALVLGASDLVYSVPPELGAEYVHGRLVLRRTEHSHTPRRAPPVIASAPSRPLSLGAPIAIGQRLLVTNLVSQANRKLDEGDSGSALSLYEQARTLDPLAPEPYFFAGVAHHGDKRFEEAVHRLRSSLFLDPTFWPASLYLALCYDRLERPGDALSEYQRVASAADAPFRFRAETSLGPDLAHWRRELIALAKRRATTG